MANEKNLRPIRDSETARALGALGGKASGESRRRKANLKKVANEILANNKVTIKEKEGALKVVTAEEAVIIAMLKKAVAGDVGAFKALMITAGITGKSDLDEKEQKARIKKMEAEAKALEQKLASAGSEGDKIIIIDDIASSPPADDECRGGFPPPPWMEAESDDG